MAEYIEREAALKALGRDTIQKYPSTFAPGLVAAANEIAVLPAANVRENVTGEWIEQWSGNGWNEWVDCTCSVCGMEFERFEIKANFCPNCGAEMSGGGNDG